MKRLLILLFALPLLSPTVEKENPDLMGKWIGEYESKEIVYLNFEPEGNAYFDIEGQIFGGQEFVFEGKKGKMTYEINSGPNPVQVDLIVTDLENGKQKKFICIADFIDNDTMEFAINFSEKTPTKSDSDVSIKFKRQK